nr:alkaline ceramidase 3-like [Ipomoea batatas]
MADGISSFWGPVTSKEWCEPNYVYSPYIAEFFNTISIVPCILLALIGLVNALRQRFEKRFSVLHISNMILAIGSMVYHATLQRMQQQGDETPMVWEMLLYLYILYSPDWHYRSTMPTFLFIYGAVFAIVHSQVRFAIGFKLHYALLCLLCVPRAYKYYIHTEDRLAKRLAKLYVATLMVGSACCLFERLFCKDISTWSFNPQATGVESNNQIPPGFPPLCENSKAKSSIALQAKLGSAEFLFKDGSLFSLGLLLSGFSSLPLLIGDPQSFLLGLCFSQLFEAQDLHLLDVILADLLDLLRILAAEKRELGFRLLGIPRGLPRVQVLARRQECVALLLEILLRRRLGFGGGGKRSEMVEL